MWGVNPINLPTMREWYCHSDEFMEKFYQYLGKNQHEVEVMTNNLVEWVRKQDEIPEVFQDPKYIEQMLINSNFDVECTQAKIKTYFQTVLQYPQVFRNIHRCNFTKESVIVIQPPRVTPNFQSIGIYSLRPNTTLDVTGLKLLQNSVITSSLSFHFCKFKSSIIICDFENLSFKYLKKITPQLLYNSIVMWKKIYRVSVSEIHFINLPPFLNVILALAKTAFTKKMRSRVVIHMTLESLLERVPKDCLPSNYGGDLKSLDEMAEDLAVIYKEAEPFFETMSNLVQTVEFPSQEESKLDPESLAYIDY